MKRLPGWRSRLSATINSFRRREMAYGEADCWVLAASCVEAITGETPWPKAWRAYKSERGGIGVMKRAGFDNLADAMATIFPEIKPSEATIGDLMAIPSDSPFGFALGVSNGERIFGFGDAFDGLGTVGLLKATRAFKVG